MTASILAQQAQVEFGEQIYKECNLQGVFCTTVPKWEEKNRRPESGWRAKYAYVHLSPAMRKVRENGRSSCNLVYVAFQHLKDSVNGCQSLILPAVDVIHILLFSN